MSIITFSILSSPPSRLDKALSRDAPAQAGLSRTRLTRLITGGHIQIDGKIELNPSSKVAEGQMVKVVMPELEPIETLPQKIKLDIIYEDEQIFAIHDINPVAKVHILIIPKKKIPTINDMSESDINLIGSMFMCAKNLAKEFDIDQTGYRLLFNTNADAMQTVFHIHLHLIGGEKLKSI